MCVVYEAGKMPAALALLPNSVKKDNTHTTQVPLSTTATVAACISLGTRLSNLRTFNQETNCMQKGTP
jgi:hypothetical protein